MPSRVTTAALAALLLLAPVGCADDDGEPNSPGGTTTTSESPASPATDAPSSTGPAAATGPLMELDGVLSLRVPGGEGWHVLDGGGQTLTASLRVDGGFFDVGGGQSAVREGATLEESAGLELQLNREEQEYPRYRHTGNRVINGVEVWVIEARRKDNRLYQLAGIHNDRPFRFDFAWPPSFQGAEELIEQILASVEWK